MVIATNGTSTMALLDGVVIGPGIQQLDFTAKGGKSVLRLLELDLETVCLSRDKERFCEYVGYLGEVREQKREEIRKLLQEATEPQQP